MCHMRRRNCASERSSFRELTVRKTELKFRDTWESQTEFRRRRKNTDSAPPLKIEISRDVLEQNSDFSVAVSGIKKNFRFVFMSLSISRTTTTVAHVRGKKKKKNSSFDFHLYPVTRNSKIPSKITSHVAVNSGWLIDEL